MTYNQIVDPYLRSLGYHRNRDSMSVEIIFPHIIMVKAYDIFKMRIAYLPLKFKAKKMRDAWAGTYEKFTNDFWKCYYLNPETKELTEEGFVASDFCDAYSDYIERYTFTLKIAVMNALMDAGKDEEMQHIISDAYLCNALAKAAATVYGRIYKTPSGGEKKCREIESIIRFSRDLSKGLGNTIIPIEDRRLDAIEDCVSILCKKTVHWLFEEAKDIINDYD